MSVLHCFLGFFGWFGGFELLKMSFRDLLSRTVPAIKATSAKTDTQRIKTVSGFANTEAPSVGANLTPSTVNWGTHSGPDLQ